MLHQSYDLILVAVSIVIASLAGFAALDLSSRVAVASGWHRARWIAASAVAMGVGIWSMHFIAMLALRLAVPVVYNVPLLVLSAIVAISASAITFTGAANASVSTGRLAVSSLAMGPAIAGMHYMGMAAMRMPARISYDPALVGLSVGIAISASFAALLLARHFRGPVRRGGVLKVGAAIFMGGAVYGMHYTGMAAARFYMAEDAFRQTADVIETDTLAWAIAAGALVVLTLALLAAFADRRLVGARARCDAILEATLDSIITIDDRGRVLDFNPAAERVFGFGRAKSVGRELVTLIIPAPLREAYERALQHARAAGDDSIAGRRLESSAIGADGQEIVVDIAITKIRVGDPPLLTVMLTDITERKRASDRLRQHALDLQRLTDAAESARIEAESARQAAEALTEEIREQSTEVERALLAMRADRDLAIAQLNARQE